MAILRWLRFAFWMSFVISLQLIDSGSSVVPEPVPSCAPTQCPAAVKFAFESGWSYIYSYESNVLSSVTGTSEDFTSIFIEAQIEIHVLQACEFQLKLRQVDLRSRDVDDPAPRAFASGHGEFQRALEEHVVRFSFSDGVVGAVCAHPKEKVWVLNLKRAIISAFQNTAKSLWKSSSTIERDVQGDCPTNYQVDYSWTLLTITKTKDLEHCDQRHVFISRIQSSPYTSPTGGFVTPIIDSSYECQQTVEDGVIRRVSCSERHLLRAFANGGAGAVTTTKQTLVLMDHVRRPALGALSSEDSGNVAGVKTSLLFDHDYKDSAIMSNPMSEAEAALAELCVQSRDDVTGDTPRLFWRFRSKLRLLDYQGLTKVFANVDHICDFSSRGQKIFRDALPLVGTVASITLIKDLILDNSVSESEVNSWVTSLAFHPRPTQDILKTVLPLLTLTTPLPKTLLSVAALVHSLCHQPHVVNCGAMEEVQTILRLVEDRLGANCGTVSPDDVQRMVTTLKALGNMGLWNGSFSALERCSVDSKNPTIVRLAAIQAYRRFGCHVNRRHLLQLFANDQEGVEVRIAAYLGTMACPSLESINEIRRVLQDEKVNQVNSFVWSHLGAAQQSVDPERRHVADILSDILLQQKYATDIRKYSRAVEMSTFSEILNAGAHVESHIVYSPSFFLPRSAMLNLTVDFFGQAVNLLEISVRAQGFEHIAESIFRPEPSDAETRSTTASPNNSRRINELTAVVQSSNRELSSAPEAAVSFKVFGQEVWYSHMPESGVHDTVRRLTGLSWMDLLDRLSMDNLIEIMRDSVLLHAVYEVPTLAGLPLSLALNATASVYLKIGGHVDIREMATGACDIEGQIRPSASVGLSASMMVDGYVGQSGVKLEASVTTSSSLDGRVKLTSQGNVKVHLNLPRERMDFIQARSDLLLTHWDRDRALRIPSDAGAADVRHCSTSLTANPLGVEFCVQLKYANASLQTTFPYFPLTGPFRLGLWAQKTDFQLNSYHMEYFWDVNHSSDDTQTVLLSFRTPRSVVDREWTAEYTLKKVDKSVLIRFLTPYKKINARGRYFDEPTRMGIISTVDVDGEEAFSFQSDLVMDVKDDYDQYQPKILVRVPTHTALSLEGLVRHNPGRHLSIDFSVEHFTLKPIVFRGEISSAENINNSRYEASLNSPVIDFTLKGFLNTIDGGLSSKTNVEYQVIDGKPETVALTMKVRYFSPPSRSLTAMSATLDLHTSAAPLYNSIATWDYQSADGHLENTITVDRTNNRQKMQVFRFQEIVTYNGTLEHNKLVGKLELIVPAKDLFVVVLMDHQNSAQMLHTKLNLRKSANKKYGFEVRLVDESTDAWKTSGQLKLLLDETMTGMSVLVFEERRSDGPPHYGLQVVCYGSLFGDANVSLNYTNQSERLMFSHRLRLGIAAAAFKLNSSADLLLTDSHGVLVVDTDVNDRDYRINGDYTRLNQTEHELSMSFHLPDTSHSARFLIGTGLEKTIKFDVRSANQRQFEGTASLLLEYDVKSSALHVAWDPEHDPSRMLRFSVRQERHLEMTNTNFDLMYLLRVAHILLNHHQNGAFQSGMFEQATNFAVEFDGVKNIGGDLRVHYEEMKNGRELRGFLDLVTPLSVLESFVVNASHADDDRSWRSHGSVMVNGGLPLTLASSGKSWHFGNQWHSEASANMNTPFSGYESLSLTLTHDLASRESRTRAKLQWTPTEVVQLDTRAIRPGANYNFLMATVNLTTPFVAYKDIRVGAQHSLSSGHLDSHLHWRHYDEDVFKVAINGDAGVRGHYYEVMGILSVITPLDGFDKFTVDITHSHDSYGLRTDIVCHVPSQGPVAIKVEGSRHIGERVSSMEFGIDVSSSEEVQLGLGAKYQKKDSDLQFFARSRWNDLAANTTLEGFYNAFTDLGFDASVKTSLHDPDSTAVSLRNKIRNRNVESWVQAHLGAAKVGVTVDARWDFASPSPHLTGRLQVDSPFAVFHHLTVNVVHGVSTIKKTSSIGRHYQTRLHSAWNDIEASIGHTLSILDRFNFEYLLHLSLPMDNWDAINVAINQSLSDGLLKTSLNAFQQDTNLLIVHVSGNWTSLQVHNHRTIFVRVRGSSDLVEPNQVEIEMTHVDDGVEYRPVLFWKTPNLESAIVLTGYMRSSSGSKMMRLTARTPIPGYDELSMSAMYSLHDTQIKYAFAAKWHNLSRFEVEGEMIIDLMAPRFKLSTLTPFPGYRVFKLDGSYNVWLKRKQALAIVIKEDWSIRLTGSGDFQSNFVDALMTMETSNPYTDHLVINLNATVLWTPEMKRIKTGLSWADDNMASVAIGFQPLESANEGMVLTASMETRMDSVTDLSSASLFIKLQNHDDHHVQSDVTVRWNDVNSVNMVLSLCQLEEVPINLTVAVKSSVSFIPPVNLLVFISNNPNGHRMATEFKIFEKRASTVWEVKHPVIDNDETQLRVQLDTSFDSFSKGSFEGTFKNNGKGNYRVTNVLSLPVGNFRIDGSLTATPGQMSRGTVEVSSPGLMLPTTAVVDFQPTNSGFDFSLKSSKPVAPLWELKSANLHYQRTESGHVVRCVLDVPKGQHELRGELSGTLSDLHLNSVFMSPLLMNAPNKLEVDATFRAGQTLRPGLRASIWVLDGRERHAFDLIASDFGNDNEVEFRLVADTSLLSSSCLDGSHALDISANMTRTNVILRGSVNVSLPCGRHYASDGRYEKDPTKGIVHLLLDVSTPIKGFSRFHINARHLGKEWDNAAVSLRLITPIEGYEKFATAFSTSHALGTSFDLGVFIDTPFRGYENISLDETLLYNLDFTGFSSDTNLNFDGAVVGFGGRYNRSAGGSIDIGARGHWRRHDPYAETLAPDSGTSKSGQVDFRWQDEGRTRSCLLDFTYLGLPWKASGSWNYSGWRQFIGKLAVETPMKTMDRLGIEASNNFLYGTGVMNGHCGLQWATDKIVVLHYGGSVTSSQSGKLEGAFNMSTPFELWHQMDGHVAAVRGKHGIVGSTTVNMDAKMLLDGTLEWAVDENNIWKNQTVVFDVDNLWRPFGVSAIVSRRQDFWALDAAFAWNLTHRDSTNLATLLLEVSSRRPSWRETHIRLNHPRHQADLRTIYSRTRLNFTHSTTLLWGATQSPLITYKVWRTSQPTGLQTDAGLRWSHPGRTLQLLICYNRSHLGLSRTNVDLWWNVDSHPNKHLRLDVDLEDVNEHPEKRQRRLKVVLRNPSLRANVQLLANVSVGSGADIFDAFFDLYYTPVVRDRFNATVSLTSRGGYVFRSVLHHGSSDLASGITAKLLRGPREALASGNIYHVTTTYPRQHEEVDVSIGANFVSRTVKIKLYDSLNGTNVLLALSNEHSNNYTLFVASDGNELHRLVYHPDDPRVEANITLENGELLSFRSGLNSPRVGSVVVTRIGEDVTNQSEDASFVLRLNSSRLVTFFGRWRQETAEQIQDLVRHSVDSIRGELSSVLWRSWAILYDEPVVKLQLVLQSLSTELQPFADEVSAEVAAVVSEAKFANVFLTDVYENNDFLVRDIVVFFGKWSDYASDWRDALESLPFTWNLSNFSKWFGCILQQFRDIANSFWNSWNNWLSRKLTDNVEIVRQSLLSLGNLQKQLENSAFDAFGYLSVAWSGVSVRSAALSVHFESFSNFGDQLKHLWLRFTSLVRDVNNWLMGKMEQICLFVISSDVYVVAHDYFVWAIVSIRDFVAMRVYEHVESFFTTVKRFMSSEQQRLMDKIHSEIVAVRDALLQVPTVVSGHPIFANISDFAVGTYHKVLWTLRYYELIPRGWETVFRMYTHLTYLFGTEAEVSSSHFDSPNYVLFAPEQRKVELIQSLPFPWKTLRQPPHFGQMEELQVLYQLWKATQSAESDISLPAFVPPFFVWWNNVAKRLDVDRWLPPFTAQAMLAGHQHFVTFDERVTEFAGPCSYLLTRDFFDGNFSVAINYMGDGRGRPTKRSLTIWLDNREIEILSNFQVTVDGRKVELPQSFGHTAVSRETNRLTLSHAYGFAISCHITYDVCSFTVSGWYTGRVDGLLGSYDYEAEDDVALPNGQSSARDLVGWGKAWTLDSCHTGQNLAVLPPHKDPVVDEKCYNLFNSSASMFNHCYHEVNPISYLHMCLSDVQTNDTPEDICTSAAAYVQRCISHNIPVRIPKLCVRCPLPSGTVLFEGDAKIVQSSSISKKADVVFIVEAKKCNRDFPKIFTDFVASVDSSLNRAGVVQRRFSTVVFGGSGIYDKPHIHTVDSKIFVRQRLISGLQNFFVGRGHSTVFDAFRFASKLPFEAGASKTFVLVACSIGDDMEMKLDYPEVHWLLLEDGITLHLLLDKEFDVKKPEVFYGIDGLKAFTAKDARSRELKGDSDLRRQVALLKDLHVPIALEVNGTVFSSLRLFGTKQVAKRFLDVFSRRLAQSAAMDVCHNCECFPDDAGVGRLYCHPCVFPRPAHVYLGPDYGFDDSDTNVHRLDATDVDGVDESEEEEDGLESNYDMDYGSRKTSGESSSSSNVEHHDDANRSKQVTKLKKNKDQGLNHKSSGRKRAKSN